MVRPKSKKKRDGRIYDKGCWSESETLILINIVSNKMKDAVNDWNNVSNLLKLNNIHRSREQCRLKHGYEMKRKRLVKGKQKKIDKAEKIDSILFIDYIQCSPSLYHLLANSQIFFSG